MFVHLLNVDSTHHVLGAQTAAGYPANAYADACLGRIVAAIEEAGIRERTTVIVLADHGFTSTPKAICPNVLLRQQKLSSVTAGRIQGARVQVIPEGGIGLIYCTHPDRARRFNMGVCQIDRTLFQNCCTSSHLFFHNSAYSVKSAD